MKLFDALFYLLALTAFVSAVGVVIVQNPIFSALFLAVTMIAVAGLFFTLEAYFIAGVQLIVYAGAVMVLFVMVVMLFDLKKEIQIMSGSLASTVLKAAGAGSILGLLLGGFEVTRAALDAGINSQNLPHIGVREIGQLLFSKYIFAFEIVSVLLLLVAVGAVAVARSRGGTHA
ncbi:MAG: NADH-quinone oxidoreductase subunit J [Bdellovibrionales bacterium]